MAAIFSSKACMNASDRALTVFRLEVRVVPSFNLRGDVQLRVVFLERRQHLQQELPAEERRGGPPSGTMSQGAWLDWCIIHSPQMGMRHWHAFGAASCGACGIDSVFEWCVVRAMPCG